MNIKFMKDDELNYKIKSLAQQERKLTKEIILHIAEVDRRKLHLKKAYPSLFDYLIKEVGYSAGAAQRRIDAARLTQKVPEVSAKIESGALNLSQISKVQKICRQLKKQQPQGSSRLTNNGNLSLLLGRLENKNAKQTDFILNHEFGIEIKEFERKTIQRDESVRVELTFSKEEMELIKKAQELLSNRTGGKLKDTLVEMAKRIIKPSETKTTATMAVKKSVTPKLRKEILQRDQSCQFKDIQTGQICGSKFFLEVDHIQPRYLRGENTPQNLRVLCKNHNIYRFKQNL